MVNAPAMVAGHMGYVPANPATKSAHNLQMKVSGRLDGKEWKGDDGQTPFKLLAGTGGSMDSSAGGIGDGDPVAADIQRAGNIRMTLSGRLDGKDWKDDSQTPFQLRPGTFGSMDSSADGMMVVDGDPVQGLGRRARRSLTGEMPAPRPGPAGAFDKAVALGAAKANSPWQKILPLAFASGAHIALGAFLAVSVGGSAPHIKAANLGLQRIILGALSFGLPMGLLMTQCAGGELVTGNMALCTAAVADGRASFGGLVRNWVTAFTGNFIGSVVLAMIAATAATTRPGRASAVAVALGKVSGTWMQAFTRGILCNWLVCMAVWMATSADDIASKAAAAVFFPISGFVALGLDHSVANMFLIPFGMMHGAKISIADMMFKSIIPVTLGNTVGGALFVALLYYQNVYSQK